MMEREKQPHTPDDDTKPIPDGGLGVSMPDWLRTPPDWASSNRESRIPAPDRSPIDPRTLVREEDLPQWLVAVSRRGIQTGVSREPESPQPAEIDSEPEVVIAEVDSRPEWVIRAAESGSPLGKPENDAAVRQWLTSGDFVDDAGWKTRLRDPVLMVLVAVAALVVIAIAAYLLA